MLASENDGREHLIFYVLKHTKPVLGHSPPKRIEWKLHRPSKSVHLALKTNSHYITCLNRSRFKRGFYNTRKIYEGFILTVAEGDNF